MPRLGWLLTAVLMTLAGCGQVEPVRIVVSMPDCANQGPTSMREGELSMVLRLDGLADVGLALVELTDGHGYDDLVEHLDANPPWERPPSWMRGVTSLRIEDGTGVDAVEETVRLDEGPYALICLEHPPDGDDPIARPAAPLEVRAR